MKKSGLNIQRELIESVARLYKARQVVKEATDNLKIVQEKEEPIISSLMDSNGFDSLSIGGIGVSKYKKKKLVWRLDKLRKKVPIKVLNEFVDKTYVITDYDGMVRYLKTCGVDAKIFKGFIDVKKEVNENKLEQMLQVGKIKKSDLTGCYSVQQGKTVIRMVEKRQDDKEV
uniref:Uncharacterized protein n=1 Tax=Dulem virus 36 TaxID=3145754 RepID=A0AAU8AYE1_9CAUD